MCNQLLDQKSEKVNIMEVFRVNFISHIKSGWLIILCVIISSIFPYGLSVIKHININSVLWIGPFMFLVMGLPAIVVHANYYIVNHGDIFQYFYQEREINFIHKGKSFTFSLDDIDYVERFMSYNQAANRAFIGPWEGYNHSYIHLKNGRVLTVTSLLVPNLRLPIQGDKILIKKGFLWLAKRYNN